MDKGQNNKRRSSNQLRTPNIKGESSNKTRKTCGTASQDTTLITHRHHHNTRQTTTNMATATVQDNSFPVFDVKKITDPEIAKLLMIQNQTITKLTQEMQELKASNADYLNKITAPEHKLDTLEQQSNTHTQSLDTINTLKDQVTLLTTNITEERSRVDQQLANVITNFQDHNDQQQLSDAVVVNSKHLPPTVTQETCMETTLQLIKDHLHLNIRSDELKDCKLMGYHAGKKTVLLKFQTSLQRNNLLKTSISMKTDVYVNECLTKTRQNLLYRLRKLRYAQKIHQCFVRDGKIAVRKQPTGKRYFISTEHDLKTFLSEAGLTESE
ncbi:uncharacterized protein [Cherax quadricarinatus]|uniref:uncharacterized protein isoform X2 n=1 Tax=Cherax quadricarinatus TaxID=27406 RepID=UPI00387EAA49